MTATQGDVASLSRFIFEAPRWYATLGFAIVLAALTGVAVFDSSFFLQGAWEGIFFIGIPTVVATWGTAMVDRALGGQLTPNRSGVLALTGEILIVVVMIGGAIVAALIPLGQDFVFDVLMFALAAVFGLWLLVIMAVSKKSLLAATIPAGLQTGTAALLLFIYSGSMRFFEIGGPLAQAFLSRPEKAPPELLYVTPDDFLLLGAFCVLNGAGVFIFLYFIDRPWRQSLGVSVLDFLRGFLGHVADQSRELEDFFEDIGEEAVVPVTVLSFRRPGGAEKARIVLPMIHPGPMGTIGGGNLPNRIAETAEGMGFPPHATAGHDFNLVTEREVDQLIETANATMEDITYSDRASRGMTLQTGEATILGQAFGDDLLVISSFAPGFADDVDFGVGLSARNRGQTAGFDDVLLVDAHNSNDGLDGDDLGHIVPGSPRSFDLIEGCGAVATRLSGSDQQPLSVGTAWRETDWDAEDGIGPLGIRALVTEVAGQRTAYVLIDGNNMEPGLRDVILDSITGVDAIEIMTSDTHIVNTVESVNQVGQSIEWDAIQVEIQSAIDEAIEDLEPVEAGMATNRATVTVFGNDRTETLASHANAMVQMGGAIAGAIIVAVLAISALLILLT